MITRIYISGEEINLFEDESIDVNSSITDVADIKKTTTDFSRDFTVPASSKNNRIFKHYYDANIENSFDARTKVVGRIELYNVPYKTGKFRLLKVNVKKGKPESYTINFVGNLVDIKKSVGKDELSDLKDQLSVYDHDFDGDTVKSGLFGSLFSGDIIYTLNPKKQYFYNPDPADNTELTEISNIADNGGSEIHGVRFSDLSPSLKAIRILEAIETKYSLTFSRDFFGTSSFNKLYQTVTNKKDSISGGSQEVDFDGGDSANVSFITNTGSFLCSASSASNDNISWRLYLLVRPSIGYEDVEYSVKTIIDGNESANEPGVNNESFNETLSVNGSQTFAVKYEVSASEEFKYSCTFTQRRYSTETGFLTVTSYVTTASENTLESIFVTANNLPKIKVIDWLVGLFKAFKLVIIPQDDGTFYVDTLNRYYSKGKIYDITKYIDFESYDVSRGELFSEINFNFEEPDTILNQEFAKNNGLAYGDEELKLTDQPNGLGEPLDGDNYDIEVPFETVVYDRLNNVETNERTNIMYAPFISEDREASFPKTNFFYNIPQNTTATPMRYITNNSVIQSIAGSINTAFHSDSVLGGGDAFIFSSEYSEWSGNLIDFNLYTNYHQRYIDSIFSIKRRNYSFSAVLPMWLATTLNLNDVLKIKGNYHRIDNYTTNINNGKTNFKLINSFANDLSNLVDGNTTKYTGYAETTETIRTNSESTAVSLVDIGFGTAWATFTIVGDNVNVTASENNTGSDRSILINLTDGDGKRTETDVLFIQEDGNITADNTLITADNTIITADNG